MLIPINYKWFDEYIGDQLQKIDDIEVSTPIFAKYLNNQLAFDDTWNNELQEAYEAISEGKDIKSLSTKFTRTMNSAIDAFIRANNVEVEKFSRAFLKRIETDKKILSEQLSDLKRYSGNILTVETVRYKYTHLFEDKIPDSTALNSFIDETKNIDKAIGKDKNISSYARLELLQHEYEELIEYIKHGKCYSEVRGKLLGKDSLISAEKFSEEIFNAFRDGGYVLSGKVTAQEVVDAAYRIEKYEKLMKEMLSQKNEVWKEYKWISDHLGIIDIIYMDNWFKGHKEEFDKLYNMYIRLKLDQLMRISHLHNQVFNARLDAIVQSYLQDRAILFEAAGNLGSINSLYNIDPVDEYALFLAEEELITIETYLAMMKANGMNEIAINESTIISLDEAAFDNLKNYLINICKKISDTIGRFVDRVTELSGADKKFLDQNTDRLVSDVMITNTATLTNYYPFSNLMANLAKITFSATTNGELETRGEAGQWQTVDDYFTQGGQVAGIPFVAGKGSYKEQIMDNIRGNAQDISSNNITQRIRSNLLGFCKNDYPSIKNLINTDLNTLRIFGKLMDTYISTLSNNNNAQTTSTVQQTITVQGGELQAQQAAFSYEDTMEMYFNEVDIKQDNPINQVPKNQAAANANMAKEEANAQKDRNKAIINATKSFIKGNSQKMSAKMNLAQEAYRQSMKILRWYLREYNKQMGENNKQNNNQNNQQQNNSNNQNISDVI